MGTVNCVNVNSNNPSQVPLRGIFCAHAVTLITTEYAKTHLPTRTELP
jgi:hypothetical protein